MPYSSYTSGNPRKEKLFRCNLLLDKSLKRQNTVISLSNFWICKVNVRHCGNPRKLTWFWAWANKKAHHTLVLLVSYWLCISLSDFSSCEILREGIDSLGSFEFACDKYQQLFHSQKLSPIIIFYNEWKLQLHEVFGLMHQLYWKVWNEGMLEESPEIYCS